MIGTLRKQRTIARSALGIVLAVLAVLAALVGTYTTWAPEARAGSTLVTVNLSETYQVMKGWEVDAGLNFEETPGGRNLWAQDKGRALRYRDLILDRLVNEVGINRIRIGISSGAEHPVETNPRHPYEKINDNGDPNVLNMAGFQYSHLDHQVENILLPLKRRIEDNGEKLFVNLCYADFAQGQGWSDLSHARQPEEFGEFVFALFDHLKRRYDIIPDAFEVILEPDMTKDWAPREVGLGLVAAAKRLGQAGFAPEFIVPSTTSAINAPSYIDTIMSVPGAGDLVTTFSYHRYDVSSSALSEIKQRARKFGKDTAMLEHVTGDAEELYADLTEADVSAWQQYAIASTEISPDYDRSFYYFIDIKDPDRPKIRMASRTPGLAQYFKFIRMGATRIGARSDRLGSKAVAFRNTDGTHVVVVNVDGAGPVSVQGLPSGTYRARYTGGDGTPRDLAVTPSVDGRGMSAAIPAAGVITFYQVGSAKSQ